LDLQSEFEISDMGEIHWLLGVEINRDRLTRTVTLSQKAYIDTICEWFGLQDAHPATHAHGGGSSADGCRRGQAMCHLPIQGDHRSLMYTAMATQPDITFTTSILAQFNQNPTGPLGGS